MRISSERGPSEQKWWMERSWGTSRLAATAGGARLDSLALANLDRGLVVDCSGTHPFLDLSGHGQECLFDVGGTLGGGLQERNAQAVGELL